MQRCALFHLGSYLFKKLHNDKVSRLAGKMTSRPVANCTAGGSHMVGSAPSPVLFCCPTAAGSARGLSANFAPARAGKRRKGLLSALRAIEKRHGNSINCGKTLWPPKRPRTARTGGVKQSTFCMAHRKTIITMGSPYFVWRNTNEIISSWYFLGAGCVTPPARTGRTSR